MKNITFITVLFLVVSLISNSSLSETLNNKVVTNQVNTEKEKEITKLKESFTGLDPNIIQKKPNNLATVENNNPIKNKNINKDLSIEEKNMYGYCAYSGEEGICYFPLDDPGDITWYGGGGSNYFLAGGTWTCDGEWYGSEYITGSLWKIDPNNGEMTNIGGGGTSCNGLAWDPVSNRLYGATSTHLIEYDPETGEQVFIGSFGWSNSIIALAINREGICYAWDVLWSSSATLLEVDLETGEATEVGSMNQNLIYAQDGAFDWDTGILYLTAYSDGGFLATCDIETGELTKIGDFEGGAEITASMIIADCIPPEHDVGVKDILKPTESGHAYPNIDMELLVKNYGNNTETFDAQMVINNQSNQSSSLLLREDFSGPFPPEGWETDSWTQCNDSCSPDPPCACLYKYNQGENYSAYITSKPVDVSEYKKLSLTFYFATNMGYPQYCNFYVKIRMNESSPWKDVTPWDKPLGEEIEGDHFEIDCYGFGDKLGEAFQIKWEYIGYYFYYNWFILDSINLEGTNDSIEYAEFVEDITLSSGEEKIIEFPSWTPSLWQDPEYENTWVNYSVYAYTILEGDQKPNNNDKYKLIELYFCFFHDIEISSIDSPIEDGPGKTYPVQATIKNVGQYAECCIHIDINIYGLVLEYSDSACQGDDLEPGESRTFEFDDWTPDHLQYGTTGSKDYMVHAEIEMDRDKNPSNDNKSEYFTLDFWHDPALHSVASPTDGDRDLLWENGDPDGRNGVGGSVYYGYENLIVDDMTLDSDVTTYGGHISLVWNSGAGVGNLDTLYMWFFEDGGDPEDCEPSQDEYTKVEITEFTETLTGDYYFGRPEVEITVIFDDVEIPAGHSWVGFMPDSNGEDIAYLLTAENKGCEVMLDQPYWGVPRWTPGSYEWGDTYDLAWQLTGDAKGLPGIKAYVQPGTQSIDAIAINLGTFNELDQTCTAEIWEYITDPENGTKQYEDMITDIDLGKPLGGTVPLAFDDFTFAYEGRYGLYLAMPDANGDDDFPKNNFIKWGIGVDDTKPVSSHTLDPPYPGGENDWYVNDLEVTLYAEDPLVMDVSSGVDFINYRVNDGTTQTIDGDNGIFFITQADDADDCKVEYWAVDSVGNQESSHTFYIDMDQTPPTVDLTYEVISGNPIQGWVLEFTATCSDSTSGMDRVEFYLNDELVETIYGPGPTYQWEWKYSGNKYRVLGLIFNPQFSDDYVKFFALMIIVKSAGGYFDLYVIAYDKAGNYAKDGIAHPTTTNGIEPGIYMFQSLTFPNNYTGKIGNFFINAVFNYY
jgi:hypothetical protein